MKTIKKYTVGLFAVAVVLLGGCTNEIDGPAMQDDEIRITTVNVVSGGLMTRAADAKGYEGIVKTAWADGDEIDLTLGNFFTGTVKYELLNETDMGWKIYDAGGEPVSEIIFSQMAYSTGLRLEARYTGQGDTEAERDVLLTKGTYRWFDDSGMITGEADIKDIAGTLNLSLAHTKSYIAVNLTNTITDDAVQDVQVVLRDMYGEAIETPVTMKGNEDRTVFECFAEAAYIERFVVTMQKSDETTYKIPVIPLYGADNNGFAIAVGNSYPFRITLNSSDMTRGYSENSIKGYGVVSLMY